MDVKRQYKEGCQQAVIVYKYNALPWILSLIGGLILALAFTSALANPTGGQVVAGSASISTSTTNPNLLTINQTSNQAIINWQSFNIGANQQTNFIQPSSSAIALNRVIGIDPTTIFGELTANGQIVIVNPAGIYFGPNSRINVASLIATTGSITNSDFLSGNFHFIQVPNTATSVINDGDITAAQGLVALVAPGVANNGIIRANLGRVLLASGNEYTIDLYGDNLINFAIGKPVNQAPIDNNGNSMLDAVSNHGTIYADGGTIQLTANVAQNVVRNVIDMDGILQAQSVAQHNGIIILGSNNEDTLRVAGLIDASGKGKGQSGGSVKILGKHISLLNGTTIDVSGTNGGGNVYVGGSLHGAGPLPNADTVYIDTLAVINANAITNGNGGNVVVWSENSTSFNGLISAEGGASGGNGGYVETSSHNNLFVNGLVDASAAAGNSGTWLMDPTNVTLSNNANTGGTFVGGVWTPNVTDPTVSNINIGNVNTALNSGTNVTITTDSGVSGQGDITIGTAATDSSIDKTAGGNATLTFDAANNIYLQIPIISSVGTLSVVFNPDQVSQTLQSGTGHLYLNNNIQSGLTNTINTNGGSVTVNGSTLLNGDTVIDTSGTTNGSIAFNGTIDGGQNLTLQNAAAVTFTSAVGSTTPLTSLALSNIVLINLGDTLTATTITGTAPTVDITSTNANIDQGISLTTPNTGTLNVPSGTYTGQSVDVTSPITILGPSVGTANVTDFTSTQSFSLGGNWDFTGNSTISNALSLASDLTFDGSNSGNLTFSNTINGGYNLTIQNVPILTFDNTVGATTPLTSLTINGSGTTDINTSSIKTANKQNYNTAVTLQKPTITLTSNNATGDISFNNTVTGTGQTLIVNSSGKTNIGANISNPGGTLTFNDAAVLTTTPINLDAAIIAFNSTLNGASDLTITSSTSTTFGGIVGGTNPLTSLTMSGAGTTNIDTSAITTANDQTYNSAITLGNSTITLTSNNATGDISFNNTVTGTGQTLIVNSGGKTNIGANISNPGGTLTFNDAAVLTATPINLNAATLNFNSTLNGASDLTISTSTFAKFAGIVGGSTPLTSLTMNGVGTTNVNTSNITTTAGQTYNTPLSINTTTALLSNTSGDLTFKAISGSGGLTLTADNGNVNLNGNITSIPSLTINTPTSGTSTQLNANILDSASTLTFNNDLSIIASGTTTFDANTISFDAPVNITHNGATVAFTSADLNTLNLGDTITVGVSNTVAGASNLTGGSSQVNITSTNANLNQGVLLTNSSGTLAINSGVYTQPIAINKNIKVEALTPTVTVTSFSDTSPFSLKGSWITSTGNFSLDKAITLLGDTILNAGSNTISLASTGTIDGNYNLTLTSSTLTSLLGNIGSSTPLTSLLVNGSGPINLSGSETTNTGGITYDGAVVLMGNTSLSDTNNGSITFNSTLDDNTTNGQDLTLNAGTGAILFQGAVGATKHLGHFNITHAGAVTFDAGFEGSNFIESNGTGLLSITGNLTTDGNTVAPKAGDITITAPQVSITGAVTTPNSSGSISFTGNNTSTLTLGSGASAYNQFSESGYTVANITGNVSTALGSIGFTDPISLTGPSNIQADTTSAVGSAPITFTNTLSGTGALTISTAEGNIKFNNTVSGFSSIDANAPNGLIQIGGNFSEGNNSVTFETPVSLISTPITITAGTLNFDSTLNGASDLSITTSTAANFDGIVGGNSPLNSLTINGAGTTDINTSAITTKGNQNYNTAVTLGAPSITLTTNNIAGNISFNNTVTGSGNTLIVNSSGTTNIGADIIDTGGTLTFNDPTALTASIVNLSAATISFNSTLNGTSALTINDGSTTTFGGIVGGTTPLTSLTINGAGTTTINTSAITTTAGQSYATPINVNTTTTLLSNTAGNLTFKAISGSGALTLTATNGNVNLNGNITAIPALIVNTPTTGTSTQLNANILDPISTLTFNNNLSIIGAGTTTFDAKTIFFEGPVNITNTGAIVAFTTPDLNTLNLNNTITVGLSNTVAGATNLSGTAPTVNITSTAANIDQGILLTTPNTGTLNVTSGTYTGQSVDVTSPITILGPTLGTANVTDFTSTQSFSLGGKWDFTGNSTISNPLTLAQDVVFDGTNTGSIAFDTIDGSHNLTIDNATTTFNNNVGSTHALSSLALSGAENTKIATSTINTSGNQTYDTTVTLASPTITLTSTGGNISLNNTVSNDGTPRDLTLDTPSGTTFIGADIIDAGGILTLNNLTTLTAPTIDFTVGTLNVNAPISAAGTALTLTNVNLINLGNFITANSITGTAPTVDITSTNASINQGIQLTTPATGTLNIANGNYGQTVAVNKNISILAPTTVGQFVGINSLSSSSPFSIGGNWDFSGNFTVSNPLTLAEDVSLNGLNTGTLSFDMINGNHNLSIQNTTTSFNNTVGNSTPLASITTTGSETTHIATNTITTNGTQNYGTPVSVDTTATLLSNTGNLLFNNITGAGGLTLTATTGNVDLNGNITNIPTFTVNTPVGSTQLNASILDPAATLTFNNNLSIIGSGTTTFDANTITFAGPVNIANTGAIVSFTTPTLNILNLGNTITVGLGNTVAGSSNLSGGSNTVNVTSTNANLNQGVLLTNIGGTLNVNQGVYTQPITINKNINVFGPSVASTNTATVSSFTNTSPFRLGGSWATSGGDINLADAITLIGDTTLNAGSNNISLPATATINGDFNLLLKSTGLTSLLGNIGGTTPLQSLVVDGPGTIDLSGHETTQGGGITYDNAVVLVGDTTLTDTLAGGITFNNTLNGHFNLIINGNSGNVLFNAPVGQVTRLGIVDVLTGQNVTKLTNSSVDTFVEPTGTGTTNLSGAGGVTNAPDGIIVQNNFITGNLEGGPAVLIGLDGIFATNVDVSSLIVGGYHGGTLTGIVNGQGGTFAASQASVASGSSGIFTINGIPITNVNLVNVTNAVSTAENVLPAGFLEGLQPLQISIETEVDKLGIAINTFAASRVCH